MASFSQGRIRVWITGPFGLYNQALAALVSTLPGLECAGTTLLSDSIPSEEADLILMALSPPSGLESFYRFQEGRSSPKVLLLTMAWTLDQVKEALQAGAAGWLEAEISTEELASAIRQVARGEVALSAVLQRALIQELTHSTSARSPAHEALSAREKEVLALVCTGMSNKQIAQRLYLSVRTVENHLASLYGKLGVSSRTEAAVLALQHGWIPPDQS
ncbi:MAG: response regulator transcription factor [Anaerolineales bacterium]